VLNNAKAINELAAMLGVDIPIVQAPMAGFQGHALASAVCNVGALGSIPCALLGPAALQQEMASMSASTTRGYNLNFFCHEMPTVDKALESAWLARLGPYYEELKVSDEDMLPGAVRMPFDHSTADLLSGQPPQMISFHFGLPPKDLFDRVRGLGSIIASSATTVAEARWLEAQGVDVIIAQGLEAGGHRGSFLSRDLAEQSGTFALLPQIVAAVDVPVIAAGGIADAEGVVAALALGAAAAQIGTSYLLCPEATTSSVHRRALRADPPRVTAITNVFSGRPARGIKNRLMEELGPIGASVPDFPLASAGLLPLRRKAEREGLDGFSPLWAGQNVSGCRELPAAELTRELARLIGR
jgi:nitronate monooxygenase